MKTIISVIVLSFASDVWCWRHGLLWRWMLIYKIEKE